MDLLFNDLKLGLVFLPTVIFLVLVHIMLRRLEKKVKDNDSLKGFYSFLMIACLYVAAIIAAIWLLKLLIMSVLLLVRNGFEKSDIRSNSRNLRHGNEF